MAVVPAAAQALTVLQYLGAQAQPAAAAAISRDLGLPRSTTYHLLDTLVRSGFVVHVAEERRYALGVAVYELASGYGAPDIAPAAGASAAGRPSGQHGPEYAPGDHART